MAKRRQLISLIVIVFIIFGISFYIGSKTEFKNIKTSKIAIDKTKSTDFRQTTWGMTKRQVKRKEKGKIVNESNEFIAYQGTISDLDCNIFYIFVQNKLVQAQYVITKTHSNQNDYILDYDSLKEILTKKYGKPTEDDTIWRNDVFNKDNNQWWGLAVSLGALIYVAEWETPNTCIALDLRGENYDIKLIIRYWSKKLEKLGEKAKEKKLLEEF